MRFFDDPFLHAICLTLLRSLWQGLVLAVLSAGAVLMTRRASARLRYNLLSVLFLLFLITVVTTLLVELQPQDTDQQMTWKPSDVKPGANIAVMAGHRTENAQIGAENVVIAFCNAHAPLIVFFWFVAIGAQCIWLLVNLAHIQRIRHDQTHPMSSYWIERTLFLAQKFQIKQRIRVLQSERVDAPLVTGWLRPVILFPLALMSRLPPEQIEAVLLHELAHIRRQDYLVNLLQGVVDILFFFNPGLLWVSSLIREERENCCDDMAIGETRHKKEFVRALMSFQEYRLNSAACALAFPGRKNQLLERCKRILTNNNKTLDNMEKTILVAGIAIAVATTLAFKQSREKTGYNTDQHVLSQDTLPLSGKTEEPAQQFKMTLNGDQYDIRMADGKVVHLTVNGKTVPADHIGDYQDVMSILLQRASAEGAKLKAEQEALLFQKRMLDRTQEEIKKQQEELMKKNEQDLRDAERKSIEVQDLIQKEQIDALNKKISEANALVSDGDAKAAQSTTEKFSSEIQRQLQDLLNQQLSVAASRRKLEEKARRDLDNQAARQLLLQAQRQSEETELSSWPLTDLIEDLMERNVIQSKDELELVLNSHLLKVNGIRQPKELHQALAEKYLRNPKNHLNYVRHGQAISVDILNNP